MGTLVTILFIFFIKVPFFLPPPQTSTFLNFVSWFDNNEFNAEPIILTVKSVKVFAPSSKDKPLTKEISKSLTSNEMLF